MAKRVLILGASGLIGTYLTNHLKEKGHLVKGTYCTKPKFGLSQLDALNAKDLSDGLSSFFPDFVVFLVGTKDVAKCEIDPKYAIEVNVQSVNNYLNACTTLNIKPFTLYLSTDYVFDGLKGYYRPNDPVGSRTIYGMTNILAERLFLVGTLPSQILRVSAVMAKQGGFFSWLENNLINNITVNLFENTYFSPTSIGKLCRYVNYLIESESKNKVTKIVHLNDGYRFSRFQFGCKIAEKLGKSEFLIRSENTDFNNTFQPDISILPSGMNAFSKNEEWNNLEDIY